MIVRSGRCLPSWRPTTIASASAATMPTVEPTQVPNQPYCVARVIVASIVLSPSSARKNATDAAATAEPVERSALACSSSVSESPRSVHAPKPKNATAATSAIQPVGSAVPRPWPTATDTACTTAVAIVMPASTGSAR